MQGIVTEEKKKKPSVAVYLLLCLFPNVGVSIRPEVPQQQGLYFFLLTSLFPASSSIPGTWQEIS